MRRSFWQTIFSLCAAASLLLFLTIVVALPLVGDVSLSFTHGGYFSIVHTPVGIELVMPPLGTSVTGDIGLDSPLILGILLAIPGIWLFLRRAANPPRLRSPGFPVIQKPDADKDASDRGFQ